MAGQMLSLSGTVISETRVYNSNLQLTELTSGNTGQMGSAYHFKYNYSATQNDGRVSSITDVASGETITYQYDTLKRLVSAAGSGDPTGAWSQTFTYDGFGNLLQKLGSNAPNVNYSVNPLNNRLTSSSAQYDLNGNLTSYTGGGTFVYDIENRITSSTSTSGGAAYAYDSTNQRVYKAKVTGAVFSNEEVYLYGIEGKKLETVSITWSGGVPLATLKGVNQWFGGRLLKPQDRLSSIGKYFPYGEDRYTPTPANPANGTEKFATYTRDTETGLDYAYQRYYAAGLGGLRQRTRREAQTRAPRRRGIATRIQITIQSAPTTPQDCARAPAAALTTTELCFRSTPMVPAIPICGRLTSTIFSRS